MVTISLSELQTHLLPIAEQVETEQQEITVLRGSTPIFRLVPFTEEQDSHASASLVETGLAFADQYSTVFKKLAQ